MNTSFLDNIVDYKRGLNQEKKALFDSLKESARPSANPHAFMKALSYSKDISLIAEIKKASPSKGIIREDFDPVAIAKIYHEHKAAAISVLTEDKYFLGQPEFIKQISDAVAIPILTKDFIIEEGQIYEACANGASAILLIVAILDDATLKQLMDTAAELGLDSLVEVHSVEELERACNAGATIIGINNRDLKTFEVDLEVSLQLISEIPEEKIVVAESGIASHKDVQDLANEGVNAVLIGETFMRSPDIGEKIEELMHGSG